MSPLTAAGPSPFFTGFPVKLSQAPEEFYPLLKKKKMKVNKNFYFTAIFVPVRICHTESLLTLYDIFSRRGFPAEITEREKTAEITENLKKNSVFSVGFSSL